MLKTIRHFDKKTREGILSAIALELGRPSVGDSYSPEYYSLEAEINEHIAPPIFEVLQKTWNAPPNDVRLLALEEIFHQLRLNRSATYSQDIQAKVLGFVGKEIRSTALDSESISTVRKRLGQKGVLPPNAYKIRFAREFELLCKNFSITEKEVLRAINYPDMVKHFVAEVQDKNDAISLYVKTVANGTDPYSLLVDAIRINDEISIHFAFRVYHSDVDVSTISSPTDLLQVFTEKFGSEISLNNENGKLFLYKKMDVGTSQFKFTQPLNTILRASRRILIDGVNEISIAYGINRDLYFESLRSHGVKIKKDLG